MADTLERLLIELSANTRSLDQGMRQASADLNRALSAMERRTDQFSARVTASTRKAGSGLSALGAGLKSGVGFAAAQAGLSGIEDLLRKIGEIADVGDLSEKIGVSTDEIQALQFAAVAAGGSVEGVNSGLLRFTQNLADAGTKSGDLYRVLQANDVAVRDQAGNLITTSAALRAYADLVANAANPQEALELAVRAFGRAAGPELVGLLSQGSAGIDRLMGDARAAGGIIDSEMVAKAQKFDDWLKQASITIRGQLSSAVVGLGNDLNTVFQKISDLGKELGAHKLARDALNAAGVPHPLGAGTMSGGTFNDIVGDAFGDEKPLVLKVPPKRKVTKVPPSGGGGSGGGGRSEAEKDAVAYKSLTDATRRRIEAMELERQTIGMTAGAAERFRTEQELLNEATRDGIPLTAERRAEIAKLAADMGAATTATDEAAEAQQRLRDILDAGKADFTDGLKGLRDAAKDGKIEMGELLDISGQLLDKWSDRAIDNLGDMLFGGGSGGGAGGGQSLGLIGDLLKSFAGGFAGGGTIPAGKWAITGENGPEIIGRKPYARHVTPDLSRMVPMAAPRLAAPRVANTTRIDNRATYHIDARGAQAGVGEEIRRAIAANNAQRDRTMMARDIEMRRRATL